MIAINKKFRYQFATEGRLILFKHILLSSILVNNRVIVLENKAEKKQLQLQLSSFENLQLQLQLQQNRVTNYNFVNYNYTFSKRDIGIYGIKLNLTKLGGFKMVVFPKRGPPKFKLVNPFKAGQMKLLR